MSKPRSHPASVAALVALVASSLALIAPPAALTVSEWADRYAVLPREGSSEPGQWKTSRAPYQRELMDVVLEPGIETVVKMIASQSGKTATDRNILWYFCKHVPSNILYVMPTKEQAEAVSREGLGPTIRDTPALASIFGNGKSRDNGNNLTNKSYPGGNMAIVGANSPRDLAGRNRRIVYGDEIDGFPASSGKEGDAITLMEARTTNYWNRLKLYSSTPTIKDASRIEKLYQQSDMRKFFMPCPQCGHMQPLEFDNLHWPGKGKSEAQQLAEECYFVCTSGHGCVITEADKPAMVRAGRWIRTNLTPVDPKMAGFQMAVFPSPWKKWSEVVTDFLKCEGKPQLLKVFYNTRLGETYELTGETVDDSALLKRRTIYDARVPTGALVLTAGIDVQGNRIECEVVGWGENDRSWSIDYFVLWGNPAMPELWSELDERILKGRYLHSSGAQMRIASAFVDSGDGNHTRRIYNFCRPRQVRRIFACKGQDGPGQTLIRPRAQHRVHRGNIDLRIVGVDTAKEALYSNLKVEDHGYGYCAFPAGYRDEHGAVQKLDIYGSEYFAQLTAEKLVTEMDGLTPVRKWVKKRERNEALDCRVYAMAALEDLHVNWKTLAKNMGKSRRSAIEEPAPEPEISTDNLQEKQTGMTNKTKKRRMIPGFNWIRS